jgi:hypothetical protein
MAAIAAISDSRQATSADPGVNSPARSAAEPARVSPTATDDEILGLTTNSTRKHSRAVKGPTESAREEQDLDQLELDFAGENRLRNGQTTRGVSSSASSETQNARQNGGTEIGNHSAGAAAEAVAASGAAEPAHLKAAFETSPELRLAWHDAKAYRETFATPQEARAATGMLADLNRMDALFFSRRPEDHAQLARAVADLDPVAFASLARAMTQVAQTAGATFPAIAARSASAAKQAIAHSAPADASAPPRFNTASSAGVAFVAPGFSPASSLSPSVAQHAPINAPPAVTPAQEQFFHSTNAAAVEGVVEAIEAQVERLLPDGISKSARNRVVGEIYRELDSTLRANRTLTQQMRDAFRSGGLDADHQKAIVSLITGRARQALPGVAKRVLNEWTTTVVSANQQRRERQRTAERRVDIGGAGGAGNEGRHSMGPREINYARMSDADILNL